MPAHGQNEGTEANVNVIGALDGGIGHVGGQGLDIHEGVGPLNLSSHRAIRHGKRSLFISNRPHFFAAFSGVASRAAWTAAGFVHDRHIYFFFLFACGGSTCTFRGPYVLQEN